jgi:large subunit ribosomal protein L31
MKEKIHPAWYPEAKIICMSCGTEWTVGATVPEQRVDICSNCHPFYTGEQRIVDTEGQVDRFLKRLQERDRRRAELEEAEEEASGPNLQMSVEDLDISKRYTQVMIDDGLTTVQDVLDRLAAEGDDGLTRISGIGRKVLADVKKQLRNLEFDVPDTEE